MTKIIVIGGKGTAVIIAEQIFDAQQRFGQPVEMLGFAFDDPAFGTEISGFPILCKTYEVKDKFEAHEDVKFIYSLYRWDKMNERAQLLRSYGIRPEKFYTFIHPSAYVARSAKLGYGCVVSPNVVINHNANLGNHNVVMAGALIGHDTATGENCFVAAHACVGSLLSIGQCVHIGLNSSIRPYCTIGDNAVIGMAANVVGNVAENSIVAGNPAKALRQAE